MNVGFIPNVGSPQDLLALTGLSSGGEKNGVVKNCAFLGTTRSELFHGLRVENYDDVEITDVQTMNYVWGIAIKSNNVNINELRAKNHNFGLITKADNEKELSGINWNNVILETDADGSGLYNGSFYIQNYLTDGLDNPSKLHNVNVNNLVLKNTQIRIENLADAPEDGLDGINFNNVNIKQPSHSSQDYSIGFNAGVTGEICTGVINFSNVFTSGANTYSVYDSGQKFQNVKYSDTCDFEQPFFSVRNYFKVVQKINTSDATPTRLLTAKGGNALIPVNSYWNVDIDIIGGKNDMSKSVHLKRRCILYRLGSFTGMIGSVQTPVADISQGGAGYSVAITADNTNNAIDITVTGALGESVRWVAVCKFKEIRI